MRRGRLSLFLLGVMQICNKRLKKLQKGLLRIDLFLKNLIVLHNYCLLFHPYPVLNRRDDVQAADDIQ